MLDLIKCVYATAWTRLRRQEGQTFVEYALIAVAVAAVAAVAAWTLGGHIADAFNGISFSQPTTTTG